MNGVHSRIVWGALAVTVSFMTAGCTSEEGVPDARVRTDVTVTDASGAMDAATTVDVPVRETSVADSACASIAATASIVRRPLDVIMVVDSSNSFDRPRGAISSTLASSLIRALETASVDYRVVVVGGAVTEPAMNPRYFTVRTSIGSGGFLSALPGYLRMALPHLRTDSLKAIVAFTDDGSGVGNRSGFYSGMTAADLVPYFGTMTMKNYTVHAVAGLAANMPPTMPWQPMAPLVTTRCAGFSANPAEQLQELARETGGYRFPLCNFTQYSNLFDAIAALAISGLQVPCDFGFPMLMDGRTPDIGYARLNITRGDGTVTSRMPVATMADCGDGFYLVRGGARGADAGVSDAGSAASGDLVRLCPSTCAAVQADPMAMVRFTFECPPG
ncbi:MAG: hypothetical protein Q8Q09_08640 [Deltaproteobacteria bacterium]|nr:hypothetical protein [Deltaproteobacteria bacterium]